MTVLTLLAAVQTYVGTDTWSTDEIEDAFYAEKAAQANVCRVPGDDDVWPADILEALCRRVVHNLAVRRNPFGVTTAESEFGVTGIRIGGRDAEVRRLEAPHRRLVIG